MKYITRNINKIASLGLIAAMLVVLAGPLTQVAHALALTSLSDIMSTVKATTLANHEIKFVTPVGGGIAAGETVTYTFNTFTTVTNVLFSDVDFAVGDTNNCSTAIFTEKTLAASPVTTTWGVGSATTVITVTSGTDTIAADKCIRLRVGANAVSQTQGVIRITNPAVSTPTITMAGTFGDTGTITVNIIADDAVAVSGTVNQTLSFSISDVTIGFGTLSSTVARMATGDTLGQDTTEIEAHNLIASTNSSSGYTVTVQGATLTSGANTITANATNLASSVGTEQFGLRMNSSGGSGTVTAPYLAAGFAYAGTASTASQVASATAVSAATTYSARYLANIAAITEAGSYTASLVYVATGNF